MAMLANAHAERIDTTSGLKIFVRSWRPATKARAVVAICHGVKSHSGYYTWVAEQFAANGLRCTHSTCAVAASLTASVFTSTNSRTISMT